MTDRQYLEAVDRILASRLPDDHELRRQTRARIAASATLVIRPLPGCPGVFEAGSEEAPEMFAPLTRSREPFAILCTLLRDPGKRLPVANAKAELQRVDRIVEQFTRACPGFGFLRDDHSLKSLGGALVYQRAPGRPKILVGEVGIERAFPEFPVSGG